MPLPAADRASRPLAAAMAGVERKRAQFAARPSEAAAAALRKGLSQLWTRASPGLVEDFARAEELQLLLRALLEECGKTAATAAFINLTADVALCLARLEAWRIGGPMALARLQVLERSATRVSP